MCIYKGLVGAGGLGFGKVWCWSNFPEVRKPYSPVMHGVMHHHINGVRLNFSIEQIREKREPFGLYRYKIIAGDRNVAIFWHDYRGDEMGIKINSSQAEKEVPFGKSSDFLTGGGPQPLGLSTEAIKYLNSIIKE